MPKDINTKPSNSNEEDSFIGQHLVAKNARYESSSFSMPLKN